MSGRPDRTKRQRDQVRRRRSWRLSRSDTSFSVTRREVPGAGRGTTFDALARARIAPARDGAGHDRFVARALHREGGAPRRRPRFSERSVTSPAKPSESPTVACPELSARPPELKRDRPRRRPTRRAKVLWEQGAAWGPGGRRARRSAARRAGLRRVPRCAPRASSSSVVPCEQFRRARQSRPAATRASRHAGARRVAGPRVATILVWRGRRADTPSRRAGISEALTCPLGR